MKKLIFGGVIAVVFLIFLFSSCNRVDAGHVGLKVNMVGGDKGVSKTEYVTGWVFINPFTQKLFEFPTYQQHKEYDEFAVPSKGGTIFNVKPSMNYNIDAGKVAEMFTTYRLPLSQIENGYLQNTMYVSMREVMNTFTVDSVLNNLATFDGAVQDRLNLRLKPYFTVTQFTSGLQPDESLKASISAKAKAIQDAITIQNQQRAIQAQAQNDIISAKRDSAVSVIKATGEAEAIRVKMQAISAEYVEYIKAQQWDGKLPQTMAGSGSNFLMQIPK